MHNMRISLLKVILFAALFAVFLTACGKKGPLYMPGADKQQSTAQSQSH